MKSVVGSPGRIAKWVLSRAEAFIDAPGIHASEAEHPCDRYLWYRLHGEAGQAVQLPDRLGARFGFAHEIEELAAQALAADGWTIEYRGKWLRSRRAGVILRPDIVARRGEVRRIWEVKTVEDCFLRQVNSLNKLLHAKFYRYRMWPVQAALYSYLIGLPATLWIVSLPHLSEVEIDLDATKDGVAQTLALEALQRIRRLRKQDDAPDPEPGSYCSLCPYRQPCNPPLGTGVHAIVAGSTAPDDVVQAVAEYVETMEAAARHARAKEVLDMWIQQTFRGQDRFVAAFADANVVLRGHTVRVVPQQEVITVRRAPYSYVRWTVESIKEDAYGGGEATDAR
jgi:CRISPR/Cas system-associated exonuclease Cas4 (RecB family)